MERIVYWSKKNPWKARFLIIAGRTYLAFAASVAGLWLAWEGHQISTELLGAASGLIIAAVAFYPMGSPLFSGFSRRKTCEFMALASALFLYAGVGNLRPLTGGPATARNFTQIETLEASLKRERQAPISPETRHDLAKRIKDRALRIEKSLYHAAEGLPAETVVGLVILSILILALVGALACGLACAGGGEGALALFTFLWLAVSAILITLMWRMAVRRHKRSTETR